MDKPEEAVSSLIDCALPAIAHCFSWVFDVLYFDPSPSITPNILPLLGHLFYELGKNYPAAMSEWVRRLGYLGIAGSRHRSYYCALREEGKGGNYNKAVGV